MAMIMHPVESFGEYSSKIDDLLAYPGARPEGSFVTNSQQVIELPDAFPDFQQVVDDYLESIGQPGLEDRIPVLGYGANANPPRMQKKLAKYGLTGDASTVPFAVATVEDVAAVWHGRPGQSGSAFAELYKGEETEGHALTTHLSFLTTEQAAIIHASEGATYSLVELKAHIGASSVGRMVLAYAGLDASILLKQGRPVAVAGLANTAPLESATAEEAVDYMLGQEGVAEIAGARTAREYIAGLQGASLDEKKDRQAAVWERLIEVGASQPYTYPASTHGFIGRLAFGAQMRLEAVHPTGPQPIAITEQLLAGIRPEDPKLWGTKTDIMGVLRTRVMGAEREGELLPGELALQNRYARNSSTTEQSDI